MESVIGFGLRFPALIPSPNSVRMPSWGFHAATATKPHLRLRLNHSPLSVPKLETTSLSFRHNSSVSLTRSSGRRPLDHIIGPVCCAANCSPAPPPKNDEKRQREQQLRDMAERLLRSQPRDLLNRLKALENLPLSDQIIDVVNVLKDSENYNLALKLLKASEQIFNEEPLAFIRFKIMEILYGQGKYQEAFDYWIRLCETESLQMRKQLFKDMQNDLFSTMIKVLECMKKKMSSKDISPDLLRSMNDLKEMDIPAELMNFGGGSIPTSAPK